MSQLQLKKFLKHNKHLMVLQPALAAALILSAHPAFAKKDLFEEEPNTQTMPAVQEMIASQNHANEPIESTISATDAALRAQQHIEGKVMNVSQYQDENKLLYGVKVLQKNGRMTTINVDANSGEIVE